MSVKKAKGKSKAKAKKAAAKNSTPKTKKGKDIVEVRENINALVKASAELIATSVIEVAKTGQLASAKYLFEAVGIYPPTEQTEARPVETTMAHQLLTRMGLPLEPVVCDEDSEPAMTSDAKGAATKAMGAAEEDPGGERGEEKAVATEDEE